MIQSFLITSEVIISFNYIAENIFGNILTDRHIFEVSIN